MKFATLFFVMISMMFGQEVTSKVVFSAPPSPSIAIAMMAVGSPQPFDPAEMLVGKMNELRERFVFAEYTPAEFEKVYNRDKEVVRKVIIASRSENLFVGKLSYSFRGNAFLMDGKTCEATLSYRVLNLQGQIIFAGVILQRGTGFSEATALNMAVERISTELVNKHRF